MKGSIKVFIVGNNTGYANWIMGEIVSDIKDCDLVLFTGGEDVDPSFYGEEKHPETYSNITRDKREKTFFELALKLNKKMLGICRGAQFLAVMSGAKLIQHQENPLSVHNIMTYDDHIIPITSTHHQAQFPWNLPFGSYKLLAWTRGISKFHLDGNSKELYPNYGKECEIVYYKDTDVLCIQGHPENMYNKPEFKKSMDYLTSMLKKYMYNVYKNTCGEGPDITKLQTI